MTIIRQAGEEVEDRHLDRTFARSLGGWKKEVVFVPIVIGTTGEVLKNLTQLVADGLMLDKRATMDLIERMSRSAVLGSHQVLKVHLSVSEGGLPALNGD